MKRLSFLLAMVWMALFLPAGRWDWSTGWWCLLVNVVGLMTGVALFQRWKNPGLLRRRQRMGRGTPAWDVGLIVLLQLVYLVQLAIASLDQGRLNGGPSPLVWCCGLVVLLASGAGFCMATAWNPYFETSVRHQRELGQQVVTQGPYALVRHPGYTCGLGVMLSLSLCTGSWWSLGAWLVALGLFSVRALLEEELMLKSFPTDYSSYMARVRYRIIPGLF